MCDILNSPCKVCSADLPLHLGDYETAPEEVECYCEKHLPDSNVRVFTITKDETYEDLPHIKKTVIFEKGWKMGIRYLTENARDNKDINHPNIGVEMIKEDR